MQPKANAANLVAQLQVETADKQQLSTKLADSETIKNELEAKVLVFPPWPQCAQVHPSLVALRSKAASLCCRLLL